MPKSEKYRSPSAPNNRFMKITNYHIPHPYKLPSEFALNLAIAKNIPLGQAIVISCNAHFTNPEHHYKQLRTYLIQWFNHNSRYKPYL